VVLISLLGYVFTDTFGSSENFIDNCKYTVSARIASNMINVLMTLLFIILYRYKVFGRWKFKMSSLNYYRDETRNVCKLHGWDKANIDTVWLLLSEEFGELASAIRQNRKTFKKMGLKKDRGTDVMMEMGDVFSYLFQLAYMLNVDMDKMWAEHGRKMKYKNYNLH